MTWCAWMRSRVVNLVLAACCTVSMGTPSALALGEASQLRPMATTSPGSAGGIVGAAMLGSLLPEQAAWEEAARSFLANVAEGRPVTPVTISRAQVEHDITYLLGVETFLRTVTLERIHLTPAEWQDRSPEDRASALRETAQLRPFVWHDPTASSEPEARANLEALRTRIAALPDHAKVQPYHLPHGAISLDPGWFPVVLYGSADQVAHQLAAAGASGSVETNWSVEPGTDRIVGQPAPSSAPSPAESFPRWSSAAGIPALPGLETFQPRRILDKQIERLLTGALWRSVRLTLVAKNQMPQTSATVSDGYLRLEYTSAASIQEVVQAIADALSPAQRLEFYATLRELGRTDDIPEFMPPLGAGTDDGLSAGPRLTGAAPAPHVVITNPDTTYEQVANDMTMLRVGQRIVFTQPVIEECGADALRSLAKMVRLKEVEVPGYPLAFVGQAPVPATDVVYLGEAGAEELRKLGVEVTTVMAAGQQAGQTPLGAGGYEVLAGVAAAAGDEWLPPSANRTPDGNVQVSFPEPEMPTVAFLGAVNAALTEPKNKV